MALYHASNSAWLSYFEDAPAAWTSLSPSHAGVFLCQVRNADGEPTYVGICRYWKHGAQQSYWTKKAKIRRHKQERIAVTHWAKNVAVFP